MLALARDMQDAAHPARPCVVVSNRPDAQGLVRAREMGVPTLAVDHRDFPDRETFERKLLSELGAFGADLVCLAGFMRVLTPIFIDHWRGRMLNIHPSILPLFPGLHTHRRALEAGMSVHGCTVHEVTSELDSGPILGQAVVPVLPADTVQSLSARVLAMEHRLYPAVLRRFAANDRTPVALFPDLAPSRTDAVSQP